HDLAHRPVPALDENIRFELLDQPRRCGLIEDDDVVHGAQCTENRGAVILTDNRPAGALDRTDRGVAVEADDELVAEAPRPGQEVDVAPVKEVEAPVREDESHRARSIRTAAHSSGDGFGVEITFS